MKKLFMAVLVIMVSAPISLFAADNSLEKVKKLDTSQFA